MDGWLLPGKSDVILVNGILIGSPRVRHTLEVDKLSYTAVYPACEVWGCFRHNVSVIRKPIS